MKGILRPTKEKYLVNEEKGIVTYFIEFEPRPYNGKAIEISYWSLLRMICNTWRNKFTAIGVAKLSPEDTFDLKKGIQIARNRAEIKLAQIEQQLIRILCKEIGRFWDYTSALYNNRSEMIKEKKEYIKNI